MALSIWSILEFFRVFFTFIGPFFLIIGFELTESSDSRSVYMTGWNTGMLSVPLCLGLPLKDFSDGCDGSVGWL